MKRRSAAARPKQRKRGASSIGRGKIDPRNRRKTTDGPCAIVGIGGSAGGFEAAMELLRHLPTSTGMAFVIVQHLDPHHASRLPKLLGKVTAMPVVELGEPTTPQPNTVYVQPPNKCVIVKDGALQLIRRTEQLNLSIDHFLESLAEQCSSRAIGVILSGSGTDGTHGLRAIKAAGGLTFAQSEASAKFNAMPRSAIRAGFVDVALAPREIAQEIRRVSDHPYIRRPMADGESAKARKEIHPKADDLGRIFFSLKKQMGVDFSSYKHATLLRRIHRRMALHRIEKLSRYAKFLRDDEWPHRSRQATFGNSGSHHAERLRSGRSGD
jgi:two-component system CheB/CheR fusion protein